MIIRKLTGYDVKDVQKMKEKMKEIPVQRVESDEGKTLYKIAGWTAFLACILLLGGVSVLQKSWGDLAPSVWMTGGMAVVGILICILGKWLQRRYHFLLLKTKYPAEHRYIAVPALRTSVIFYPAQVKPV